MQAETTAASASRWDLAGPSAASPARSEAALADPTRRMAAISSVVLMARNSPTIASELRSVSRGPQLRSAWFQAADGSSSAASSGKPGAPSEIRGA